ncbi:MAG: alpha/beta hydrolase-fold protein [Acidobacteriota bacterium]
MKLIPVGFIAVLVGCSLVSPLRPQATRTPARPFWAADARSPEVSSEGRVTVRLYAPNAREVQVVGFGREPLPLQKDEQGIWSATTDPLAPDLYEYSFLVDGLRIPDPGNPRVRASYARCTGSLVLVPGDVPWTPVPEAPRGAVTRHVFRSAVAGDERELYVYTPPGYDPQRERPYPVLYLLHGLGDDARAWIEVGAANVILDTLIHQGKAEPMVMVNPLGYGTADGPADIDREEMLPNFARILLEEVMPLVEQRYHVSRQPAGRAIAGLSMGGGEAVLVGLNHLDQFAWIGSFSGAFNNWMPTRPPEARRFHAGPFNPEHLRLVTSELPKLFPGLDAGANQRIRLLWIACGTADMLIRVNREFKAYLDSLGIAVRYREIPDVGHVWPLWRRNLAEFVPLLFK